MVKKSRKQYTLLDHVFAITLVILMCFVIISIPFVCFYFVLYCISITPDVDLKSLNTFASLKIIFQFFATTVMITGVVDVIFSQIMKLKSGVIHYLSEIVLMFLVFYLFVMIYCRVNDDIIIKHNGNLYIALFLLVMYLTLHIIYIASKKLYTVMMNRIQNKHSNKNV
jgi:hypothetical protein